MKDIIKTCTVLACLMALTACTRPDASRDVLVQQGYTKVNTGGYGFFACDEKDTFSTKFTATSPAGAEVSGVVCSGLFKGHTIRFN